MRRLVATIAVIAGLTTACSSSSGGDSGAAPAGSSGGLSGSITVFAASSLTEAFTTLADQFKKAHPGTNITFSFDSSSTLASNIMQGQKADVFASASTSNMDTVVQAGDAESPTDFASNTMEIATPPGNPANVKTVADLAKAGVKVAVCDPAVPCGATAQQVFTNAKVTVNPTANEADVKSTLAVVETKEVDAGMVYVTDVKAAGSKVTGVEIPSSINATTTYPVAVLKKTGNHGLAQAWVDYVLSDAGQKVLRADGFSKP